MHIVVLLRGCRAKVFVSPVNDAQPLPKIHQSRPWLDLLDCGGVHASLRVVFLGISSSGKAASCVQCYSKDLAKEAAHYPSCLSPGQFRQ